METLSPHTHEAPTHDARPAADKLAQRALAATSEQQPDGAEQEQSPRPALDIAAALDVVTPRELGTLLARRAEAAGIADWKLDVGLALEIVTIDELTDLVERRFAKAAETTPSTPQTPEPAAAETSAPLATPTLNTPPGEVPSTTHEHASSSEKNSYEGGWGFFDEGHSLNPPEYQVTADDDLWVKDFLTDDSELPTQEKPQPLTPEQKAIANAGTARAAALVLGLDLREVGGTPTMLQIRSYIDKLHGNPDPKYAERLKLLRASGRDVHYQNIRAGRRDRSLNDAMEDGWEYEFNGEKHPGKLGVDYLHLGRIKRLPESADKLDEIMRVYVYAKPEYAGEIAATVLEDVKEKTGHVIYGKLWDVSTSDEEVRFKDDNLLFYVQRHGDMGAIAGSLRRLAAAHPEMFDASARPTDRARKTDIPGVALAEEPVQLPDAPRESFNSHRDEVQIRIEEDLIGKIVSCFGLEKRYPGKQFNNGYTARKIIKEVYKLEPADKKAEFRAVVKQLLRDSARAHSADHHVSPDNFAMNAR